MAASASITGSRTRPISAGSWRPRLKGWGGDALLPSYSEERRPDFQGDRRGFHRRPHRDRPQIPRTLQPRARPRRVRAGLAGAAPGDRRRDSAIRAELRGLVGRRAARPAANAAPTARTSSAPAPATISRRKPCPRAATCSRSSAPDFTLLAFDADPAPFADAARSLGIPLTVVRDSFAGGREAYEARLVLVRPDQYVAWTGDRPPPDPAAILRKVTGQA